MSEPRAVRASAIAATGLDDLVGALDDTAATRIVREAMGELDAAAVAAATELAKLEADIALAEQGLAEARSRAASQAREAMSALAIWRDDVAEAAIGRQLALEARAPSIESALVELSARHAQMAAQAAMIAVRRDTLEADLAAYDRALRHHAGATAAI